MATWEQKKLIFDKLHYTPSSEQEHIHKDESRIRLVAGGERGGKSLSAAMEYLSRFWETPLLWLVAQDYERTKQEFNYICDGFDKLGINYQATKRVDPGEILVTGGFRITTRSARDPHKIAMEAPDGIVVCEASQIDYETYLRLRGRLAERRGWLLMAGTFETSLGWYPELFQRWQLPNAEDARSFSLPTWTNLAIFPGGRGDPEILALEKACSKEWFQERFGGVPCPPQGRVFNEFSNVVHVGVGGQFEFDPVKEVYLWIDPGYASAYAVLVVQKHGEHIFIIDEIFERDLVTSDIIKVAKQKPWWNKVIGGAVDVAAMQHQAMPAPAEIWLREAGVPLRSQKVAIRDGIERVKSCLLVNPTTGQPMLHINAKCRGLISELGGCENPLTGQTGVYQWKRDRGGNIIGEMPEDRNNHACKALAYGLVDLVGYSSAHRRAKIRFY